MSLVFDVSSFEGLDTQLAGGSGLPGFAHVGSFLRPEVYAELTAQAHATTDFATWSIGAVGEDQVAGAFEEPTPGGEYGSVRERATVTVPIMKELADTLGNPEHVAFLREASGLDITRLAHAEELAAWPAGSFTGAHTDFEPDDPMKLVVNLSLTDTWDASYGGNTVYWHEDGDDVVTVTPAPNAAGMFRPSPHAYHWVEPVKAEAPGRTRMGWALAYG